MATINKNANSRFKNAVLKYDDFYQCAAHYPLFSPDDPATPQHHGWGEPYVPGRDVDNSLILASDPGINMEDPNPEPIALWKKYRSQKDSRMQVGGTLYFDKGMSLQNRTVPCAPYKKGFDAGWEDGCGNPARSTSYMGVPQWDVVSALDIPANYTGYVYVEKEVIGSGTKVNTNGDSRTALKGKDWKA